MLFSTMLCFMLLSQEPGDSTSAIQPGTHVVKLQVGVKQRRFVVRVPPQYDGKTKLPAVLIFHGAGGTGRLYLDKNGWEKKADREGFLAVAPDGQSPLANQPSNFRTNPQLWNDGSGRGRLHLLGDDSKFVAAILDELERRFHADPARFYLTGHSNGAGLTFGLAQKLGDRVAAIAPVMSHCWAEEPKLPRPVPTLFIVGMKDPLVPFAGGEAPMPWGTGKEQKPPIAQTISKWCKALGCATPPKVNDEAKRRTEDYANADGRLLLRVIILKEHGHGWPGGKSSGLPESAIGPMTQDCNATDEIWAFFKDQRLK